MGDVTANILDMCSATWGDHPAPNADEVFDLYERILGHYPNDVLKDAFVRVASEFRPGKRFPWPAPALFKEACDAAMPRPKPAQSANWNDVAKDWPEPTPEGRARCNALVESMKSLMKVTEPDAKSKLPCVDRTAFENRANRHTRTRWIVEDRAESLKGALSKRSRDMTGDRDE